MPYVPPWKNFPFGERLRIGSCGPRRSSGTTTQVLATEDIIRKQINRDENCTEASLRLMAMRTTMLGLIGKRDSLGGSERLLDVEERLKAEYRAVNRKPLKGALGRRER